MTRKDFTINLSKLNQCRKTQRSSLQKLEETRRCRNGVSVNSHYAKRVAQGSHFIAQCL